MKQLLFVADKLSTERILRSYLRRYSDWTERYDILFDYFGCIMDCRRGVPPFYKHGDTWYLYGKPSEFTPLVLPDLEIPTDTYLEFTGENRILAREYRAGTYSFSDIERIIFLTGAYGCPFPMYPDDVFGARRYLEETGLPMTDALECVSYRDQTDKGLMDAFFNIRRFKEVYEDVKNGLLSSGFPYDTSIRNPFDRLVNLTGMSFGKFCEYFHLKRRTAENWRYGICDCPEALLELMEYKLVKEGVI